jgi:hypothetical protein
MHWRKLLTSEAGILYRVSHNDVPYPYSQLGESYNKMAYTIL